MQMHMHETLESKVWLDRLGPTVIFCMLSLLLIVVPEPLKMRSQEGPKGPPGWPLKAA